ncbi:FN3 associated domain-containing protein [Dyadobacter sp. LHD-138]|uniref:FN3 associated domain-containing protein n=1 Tax=Dyadobacter sp. LHD-138 TaxID=3071413 RepID=UPI0027DF027B|nr:FN3 associated domain-containing protein [Dyadobacter sp. LHD-138]MDQ6477137.1 FN3 associated domain-containing protein [Dyadobacter sp. LHD-138]
MLHFPLVALMLYGFWVIIVKKSESTHWNPELADALLLIGTFMASIAAFSGFILSKEEGYEADAIFWHKWLGIAISLVSLTWYSFRVYLSPWKTLSKLIASGFLLLLFIGGHLGGNLTHGEDFLISPVKSSGEGAAKVAFDQAKIFQDLVQPVLDQKCISCHNEEKSKGNLQMQTQALLAKGGKNGVLWDTTKTDLGLLISRVHLPLDDKKHMPPRGKVQLTDEEIELIAAWVKLGSRFDQLVSSLPPQNPIQTYAQNVLGGSSAEEKYDFGAADPDEVSKLNTTYRLIKPLSAESPALLVNFYNRANFKSEAIEALLPLKDQIISMDLSKMPVKDGDLKTLAKFHALRRLILNFTEITGASLADLKKLTNLKELSLSGTTVKAGQVKSLASFPSLKKAFVWSTGLTPEELAQLKKEKKITFETGFRSDTLILPLNAPMIENENQIIAGNAPISMKHQIPGTVIRYTLDGTEPDSVKSPVYNKPFAIGKNTFLKARAFKKGWYGSKQAEKFFFKAGFHIDSVKLITAVDQKYKANGNITIADGVKSERQQNSGKWLGYRDNEFQSYLLFKKPVKASNVTLSMLRNVGGFVFPPVRIEVWGGANEKSLKLLKVITPEMPVKETPNSENLIFDAGFEPQELSCIKLVARPLSKLPAWHPKKGEKAWVLVDEVFVN